MEESNPKIDLNDQDPWSTNSENSSDLFEEDNSSSNESSKNPINQSSQNYLTPIPDDPLNPTPDENSNIIHQITPAISSDSAKQELPIPSINELGLEKTYRNDRPQSQPPSNSSGSTKLSKENSKRALGDLNLSIPKQLTNTKFVLQLLGSILLIYFFRLLYLVFNAI